MRSLHCDVVRALPLLHCPPLTCCSLGVLPLSAASLMDGNCAVFLLEMCDCLVCSDREVHAQRALLPDLQLRQQDHPSAAVPVHEVSVPAAS